MILRMLYYYNDIIVQYPKNVNKMLCYQNKIKDMPDAVNGTDRLDSVKKTGTVQTDLVKKEKFEYFNKNRIVTY